MKNLTTILLITVLLASCKPEAKVTCLISGTVKNTPDKELKLLIGNQAVDTLKVNADGTFSKEVAVNKPCEATLRGTQLMVSLYLAPGKDLAITSDASDRNKDLAFAGTLAADNDYLIRIQENQGKFQEILDHAYRAPNTPADFKRIRDSIRLADLDFLRKFTSEKGKLDPAFLERQKLVIQFNYYGDLRNYPAMSRYFNTDKPAIPDDWNSFMNGVNLDDPALLDISDIQYFIFSYVTTEALKAAGIDPENAPDNRKVMEATSKYLLGNFKHPEFYNMIAFEVLKGTLEADGTKGLDAMIGEYMTKATDEANKKTLKELAAEWVPMAPGQPAPVFNLPDIEGKMVSLTDFAGKYVFIDFWATWCGPCKAEVPSYQKLIEDYKGKNIVFISISVDKDKAAWEKMVREGIPDPAVQADPNAKTAEKKMVRFTWLQLHDAVKYNKIWLVKYIPTFVLIDPQGKIVNARAQRPSDEALRGVIDALPGI